MVAAAENAALRAAEEMKGLTGAERITKTDLARHAELITNHIDVVGKKLMRSSQPPDGTGNPPPLPPPAVAAVPESTEVAGVTSEGSNKRQKLSRQQQAAAQIRKDVASLGHSPVHISFLRHKLSWTHCQRTEAVVSHM